MSYQFFLILNIGFFIIIKNKDGRGTHRRAVGNENVSLRRYFAEPRLVDWGVLESVTVSLLAGPQLKLKAFCSESYAKLLGPHSGISGTPKMEICLPLISCTVKLLSKYWSPSRFNLTPAAVSFSVRLNGSK